MTLLVNNSRRLFMAVVAVVVVDLVCRPAAYLLTPLETIRGWLERRRRERPPRGHLSIDFRVRAASAATERQDKRRRRTARTRARACQRPLGACLSGLECVGEMPPPPMKDRRLRRASTATATSERRLYDDARYLSQTKTLDSHSQRRHWQQHYSYSQHPPAPAPHSTPKLLATRLPPRRHLSIR